jgi:hypothetical protein
VAFRIEKKGKRRDGQRGRETNIRRRGSVPGGRPKGRKAEKMRGGKEKVR